MIQIQVEHLRKVYGDQQVLNDVSFTVTGERPLCVMAPSGAGKTTLLRILLGLEQLDGGQVSQPDGCRWAAVFQENRLLEHLNAVDNLRFALGKTVDGADAAALLRTLGLDAVGDKPVREYSGGMKRRLALARALLAPSDALALDEPFAGLDEENRARAVACIRSRTAGKPVLVVTHDEADAVSLKADILHL